MKQGARTACFLLLCVLPLSGGLAQEEPGLETAIKVPPDTWFAIRRGQKSIGVARLRAKPVSDGFELTLHAELKEGDEQQVLDEQVRVGPTLELRTLSWSGELKEGDAPPERSAITVAVEGEGCKVELKQGDEVANRELPWTPGGVCGLTTRLVLPYRIERGKGLISLVELKLDGLVNERLQARWQAPTPEGSQRLVVGSEEIADTWGFVVDAERKLEQVLTADGLTWTREPDEAAARKDVVWPPDDPRRVVQRFLAAVQGGDWKQAEPQVDWARLAKALEEPDEAVLRERVRAALGDPHADEDITQAQLRLSVDGEERLVAAEGIRFRLARGDAGWRIVGIEGR